ncbi:MAG: hypothetical protein Q8R57_12775 [Bacteroidota bacterium]|nr:hypothetical protein [Bacteroidota bacterium]
MKNLISFNILQKAIFIKKITKKYTFILIGFCALLTVFHSCKKCPDEVKDIYVYLTDSDKARLPYTGDETLVFYREPQNDTLTFFGQGIQPYTIYLTNNPGGDCAEDNYVKEGRAFFFRNAVGLDGIVLKQQLVTDDLTASFSEVEILFSNYRYLESTSQIGSQIANDSIIFNLKTYKDLTKFGIKNYNKNVPINNRCYINKTDGIVRIVMPDGTTLTLIEKK